MVNPNHIKWNNQQQALRQALKHPEDHERTIQLFLDHHAMVHSAVMSGSGLWSFEDEIWKGLTEKHIRQIPSGGEHSIAWIFWHLTRIEDVTMNLLLAGRPQLFIQEEWLDRLGIPFRDTGNAMSGADVVILSDKINIDALRSYRIAIGRRTRENVMRLPVSHLTQKVEPARLKRVIAEGAVVEEARGVLEYWGGLTYAGLLLMPPTRHNFIHLNEALLVKKKVAGRG
jgi:hypothetical protein